MEAAARVRRELHLADGRGSGLGALAAALEPVLAEVAGPGATCVSVSLEFGRPTEQAGPLQAEAWVERTTRTLVFAAAQAHAVGRLVVSASAVFSRRG